MGWYQSYQLRLQSDINALNGDKVMKYLHLSAALTWESFILSLKGYNITDRLKIDDLWIIYCQWIITWRD